MKKKPAFVLAFLLLLASLSALAMLLPFDRVRYAALFDGILRAVVLAVLLWLFFPDLLAFAKERGSVGPLWILPCVLVALANFPLSALLCGTAVVTLPEKIPLLFLQCLLIGCTEEVAFRGVIHRMAVRKLSGKPYGYLRALLLSSGLFGAFHLLNIFEASPAAVCLQAGYTFLLGCMFAVCYDRTRRLSVCCILHAVFDFGGHLISDLGEGDPHDTFFVVITAVCAVACGLHILASLFATGAFDPRRTRGGGDDAPDSARS